MAVALPPSIRCNGANIIADGNDNPGHIFLGPATNKGSWSAECGQTLAGAEVYQVGTASSWYDCAKSCDLNALCTALGFDPSSGSCTQYASFSPNQKTASATTWIMTNSAAQGPNCVDGKYAGYDIECNIDYQGGDIGSKHDISFKDCISLCDQTSGCIDVAFTQGHCYLKGSLGPRITNNGVWTAKKTGVTQGLTCVGNNADGKVYNGYKIECGIDYAGNDIGSASAPTFESCIDKCIATSGCVDVSYAGNMCYLKSKLNPPSNNANVWTARRQDVQWSYPKQVPTCQGGYPNTDRWNTDTGGSYSIACDSNWAGNDFASKVTADFVDCMSACDTTSGCVAVTYSGNTCYMKNAAGSLQKQTGSWAAVSTKVADQAYNTVSCPRSTTYQAKSQLLYRIDCGVDYFGGDLAMATTTNFQSCIDKCDATAGCITVSYRGNNCYMKNKRYKTGNPSDSEVWSAYVISSASGATPIDRPVPSTSTTTTTTTTVPTTLLTTTTTTTSASTIASPSPGWCLNYFCYYEGSYNDLREGCCPGAICDIPELGGESRCHTCVADGNLCNSPADCCTPNAKCTITSDTPQGGKYGVCGK